MLTPRIFLPLMISPSNKALFVSSERLYQNKDGKVVGAKSPDKASLLIAEGGTMPLDQAKELGLVKAVKAPRAARNNAVRGGD